MTNADRALRAEAAILTYMDGDREFYLGDLLGDLQHWLDTDPMLNDGEFKTIEEACTNGRMHHDAEVAEENEDDDG